MLSIVFVIIIKDSYVILIYFDYIGMDLNYGGWLVMTCLIVMSLARPHTPAAVPHVSVCSIETRNIETVHCLFNFGQSPKQLEYHCHALERAFIIQHNQLCSMALADKIYPRWSITVTIEHQIRTLTYD